MTGPRPTPTEPSIECGFCRHEYRASQAGVSGCAACPKGSGHCGMARCPRCGYDNPVPAARSGLLARLLSRWRRQ